MVSRSQPAWDFLSGKREEGLKPPEWLLIHKGPSLSLVPSSGPPRCSCLCLAHVRKCCVLHASIFNKSGTMPASSISLVLLHFLQIQFLPFWTEKSLKHHLCSNEWALFGHSQCLSTFETRYCISFLRMKYKTIFGVNFNLKLNDRFLNFWSPIHFWSYSTRINIKLVRC